jgi:hypothetical protein
LRPTSKDISPIALEAHSPNFNNRLIGLALDWPSWPNSSLKIHSNSTGLVVNQIYSFNLPLIILKEVFLDTQHHRKLRADTEAMDNLKAVRVPLVEAISVEGLVTRL